MWKFPLPVLIKLSIKGFKKQFWISKGRMPTANHVKTKAKNCPTDLVSIRKRLTPLFATCPLPVLGRTPNKVNPSASPGSSAHPVTTCTKPQPHKTTQQSKKPTTEQSNNTLFVTSCWLTRVWAPTQSPNVKKFVLFCEHVRDRTLSWGFSFDYFTWELRLTWFSFFILFTCYSFMISEALYRARQLQMHTASVPRTIPQTNTSISWIWSGTKRCNVVVLSTMVQTR